MGGRGGEEVGEGEGEEEGREGEQQQPRTRRSPRRRSAQQSAGAGAEDQRLAAGATGPKRKAPADFEATVASRKKKQVQGGIAPQEPAA